MVIWRHRECKLHLYCVRFKPSREEESSGKKSPPAEAQSVASIAQEEEQTEELAAMPMSRRYPYTVSSGGYYSLKEVGEDLYDLYLSGHENPYVVDNKNFVEDDEEDISGPAAININRIMDSIFALASSTVML